MAQDTIKFSLEGDVSETDLRTLVDSLVELIQTLTEEADDEAPVQWVVADLSAGSATVAFRGRSDTAAGRTAVSRTVDRYGRIAEDVAHRRAINDASPAVYEQVVRLTSLVNGRKARMSADDHSWVVDEPVVPPQEAPMLMFEGRRSVRMALKGTVVMLDRKRGLYFTLKEAVTGRLVRCYPSAQFRANLADYWTKETWVLVEGTLTGFSGTPTLTFITDIVALPSVEPGSWRKAVGIAPRRGGGLSDSAADVVRKVRDGQ